MGYSPVTRNWGESTRTRSTSSLRPYERFGAKRFLLWQLFLADETGDIFLVKLQSFREPTAWEILRTRAEREMSRFVGRSVDQQI